MKLYRIDNWKIQIKWNRMVSLNGIYNNRETDSSSKKEHRNIGKMFVYTVDALAHNAEEAKRKDQLRSRNSVMFLQ